MGISSKDIAKLPQWAQKKCAAPYKESRRKNQALGNASRFGISKTVDGFDSGDEREYFQHLEILQLAGEISNLKRQIVVPLHIGKNRYMRVDFMYFDNRLGEIVYDEYKGPQSEIWQFKRDLWAAYGPGLYRVTQKRCGRFEHFLEIRPKPKSEFITAIIAVAGIGEVEEIITQMKESNNESASETTI